mmetsp:Transcript_85638/g.222752  ORF Transcript_85638/g.222752 Transcript_85638/m.222752 type:complete len:122 (+) Transcript_85638:66-431(+)
MSKWSTGTFECCKEPGGSFLCVKTCCCPCFTIGDINEAIDGPGGWAGGCLGDCILTWCCDLYCLCPLYQGLEVAKKANFEESVLRAIVCSCCCCGCYTCQQAREVSIKNIGKGGPGQQEMS